MRPYLNHVVSRMKNEPVIPKDKVLEFIKKRFPVDCHWMDGNCYYFAIMLKERFNDGEIYYNAVDGHFLFRHKAYLYDFEGRHAFNKDAPELIVLKRLKEDTSWYSRIRRDCIL